jgi:RNA 2',3'-cyclic 3'-phosphodiesterase
MRAFIAVELPPEIRTALSEIQARLQAHLSSDSRGDSELRWTRPEGIHLTLKFLGEISERQSAEVVKLLRRIAPSGRFTVEIRGYGFFPDRRRPQVLWAGVIAPPALAELARRIDRTTASIGFPTERRTFAPHLTLARFKSPRRQPALEALLGEFREQSVGHFEVSEFFLFESRLSFGSPAEYRKVARFPDPDASTSTSALAPIGQPGLG